MKRILTPWKDRFPKHFSIGVADECWNWAGAKAVNGYGRMKMPGRNAEYAHRLSWEFHIGKIPIGIWVLHHCDNPGCVNPSHLFLGTQTDNMRDMAKKNRSHHMQKTRCPHRHKYDIVRITSNGRKRRDCSVCHLIASRKYKAKLRRLGISCLRPRPSPELAGE